MKVLCFIDYLESGGAQRQLCLLARLLKQAGHEVRMLTYFEADFYKSLLQEAEIPVDCCHRPGRFGRLWASRQAIRRFQPDVVIAFLNTPSLYAEIARLPWAGFKLVVSERNTDYGAISRKRRLNFFMHRFADAVVPNSQAQAQILAKEAPWLRKKVQVITNCVDLKHFHPAAQALEIDPSAGPRIIVPARFHAQKNPLRLAEAVKLLRDRRPGQPFTVNWFGNRQHSDGESSFISKEYLALTQFIETHQLGAHFQLHEPDRHIIAQYQRSQALCLPSLYEGFPNVIGEAMACGLPILASDVADNRSLVVDGVNGFLFDPLSPESIAAALGRFLSLTLSQSRAMGAASRERAEVLLGEGGFARRWQDLLHSL